MSGIPRFRERVPPLPPSFRGNSKGKKLGAGDVIGIFREFRNNTLWSSQNIHLTGTPTDSFAVEKTWDIKNPGPPYKTGGPFSNVKVVVPRAAVKGYGKFSTKGSPNFDSGRWFEYEGGFTNPNLSTPGVSLGPYMDVTHPGVTAVFPELSDFGPKAWDKLRPDLSGAGLSVFLGELRDLPGMLKTSAKGFRDIWLSTGKGVIETGRPFMHPKGAADHFLNHTFGWAPFVSDLTDFVNLYQNASTKIAQIQRDNGMTIRRERTLERSHTRERIAWGFGGGCEPSGFQIASLCDLFEFQGVPTNAFWETVDETTSRVWASGQFTYYVPEFDPDHPASIGEMAKLQRYLTIYGARINPDVIWKLTPWTWLIDWLTGLGRNIRVMNEIAEDQIVAKYLYIMRKQTRKLTQFSTFNFWSGVHSISWPIEISTKQRAAASSPYGFDLPWDGLSPKQLAILTALGITRA